MSNIKFHQHSLESAFDQFYLVPDYQREYIWAEEEVVKLLDDIHDEFKHDKSKEYYIGSTVVFKNNDGIFELIDGQQRTTTLFLLVAAFKKLYQRNNADVAVFADMMSKRHFSADGTTGRRNRIVLQYLGTNDVIDGIINDELVKGSLSKSSERIRDALETIDEWLSRNMDFTRAKEFWIYCLRKVAFIQIETMDLSRALKIFETINERGVGLNSMDLLKNLVFRRVNQSEYSHIKSEWESMVRLLEKHKEKPLRFLRYYIMSSYEVGTGNNNIIREDGIYTWFTQNEEKWNCGGNYIRFLSLLKEGAKFYIDCYTGLNSTDDGALENIRHLGGSAYRQHLMLLLAGRNLERPALVHFAKQIETLVFVFTVIRKSNRDWELLFSQLCQDIRAIQTNKDLNVFIECKLIPIFKENEAQYRESFLLLGTDYLTKGKVKYVLAKLSKYVDGARSNGNGYGSVSELMDKKFEIEHIFPTSQASASNDLGIQKSARRIGNLALLEKSINASIADGDPSSVKFSAYKNSGLYLTRSISGLQDVGGNTYVNRMNARLRSFNDWSPTEIAERQQMLYELSLSIWKFEPMAE